MRGNGFIVIIIDDSNIKKINVVLNGVADQARAGDQRPQLVHQVAEHLTLERVEVVPAPLADLDQPGLGQDLGVVGDRRLGDGQGVLEDTAGELLLLGHLLDDVPADRVSQRLEDLCLGE